MKDLCHRFLIFFLIMSFSSSSLGENARSGFSKNLTSNIIFETSQSIESDLKKQFQKETQGRLQRLSLNKKTLQEMLSLTFKEKEDLKYLKKLMGSFDEKNLSKINLHVDANKILINGPFEKITIEPLSLSEGLFKINDKVIDIKSKVSLKTFTEDVQKIVEPSLNSKQKKTSLLNSIFIQQSHAQLEEFGVIMCALFCIVAVVATTAIITFLANTNSEPIKNSRERASGSLCDLAIQRALMSVRQLSNKDCSKMNLSQSQKEMMTSFRMEKKGLMKTCAQEVREKIFNTFYCPKSNISSGTNTQFNLSYFDKQVQQFCDLADSIVKRCADYKNLNLKTTIPSERQESAK